MSGLTELGHSLIDVAAVVLLSRTTHARRPRATAVSGRRVEEASERRVFEVRP